MSARDTLLRHLRKAHRDGALCHEAFNEDAAWAAILDALRRFDPSRQNAGVPLLPPQRAKEVQDACDVITAALAEPVVAKVMDWSMEGSEGFDPETMAQTVARLKQACRLATARANPNGGTPKRTFFEATVFSGLADIFKEFSGAAPCPAGVVRQGPFVDFVEDFAKALGIKSNRDTIMRYLRDRMKD